jgi:hypothetical protein
MKAGKGADRVLCVSRCLKTALPIREEKSGQFPINGEWEGIWAILVGLPRVTDSYSVLLGTLIISVGCDQHPCFYLRDNGGRITPRLFVLQFSTAKDTIGLT